MEWGSINSGHKSESGGTYNAVFGRSGQEDQEFMVILSYKSATEQGFEEPSGEYGCVCWYLVGGTRAVGFVCTLSLSCTFPPAQGTGRKGMGTVC